MSRKLALSIYLLFLLIYLLITGGRIASSDGLTMFYVTQSIIERGEVAVPGENVTPGQDNKLYSRYGLGQSLIAIPFYLVGSAVSPMISKPLSTLVIKASVSLTNAFVGAGICLIFFAFCLRLGYSRRIAFWLTLGLGIGSFFFPYTKSFLSEPLQTLCLLGAVYGLYTYFQTGALRWIIWSGIFSGFGLLTKLTFVLNIVALMVYFFLAKNRKSNRAIWLDLLRFALPIIVAGVVIMWYNLARFGSVLATGYGQEATIGGFSTPLYVGLYGLLFSAGKGYFWFTPLAILGLVAFREFARRHRQEAFLFAALFVLNLLLYAKFKSWAGEGSWGPRYLVPALPFLLLPIGASLSIGVKSFKRWFFALLVLGVMIQLPGISIYFGSYYREIGEFPYQRQFTDPLFLHKSRYVPNYSQIVGQWRMLVRNAEKLLSGDKIELRPANEDSRIPLSEEQRIHLLNTLDYWFTYATSAGISPYPCLLVITILLFCIILCYRAILKQLVKEEP